MDSHEGWSVRLHTKHVLVPASTSDLQEKTGQQRVVPGGEDYKSSWFFSVFRVYFKNPVLLKLDARYRFPLDPVVPVGELCKPLATSQGSTLICGLNCEDFGFQYQA